jgi:alkylation response protein AidB-like acyl-CoA dehydrogenase
VDDKERDVFLREVDEFCKQLRPGRHLQDARVCRLYEGTVEIMKLKIASSVLGKECEAYH